MYTITVNIAAKNLRIDQIGVTSNKLFRNLFFTMNPGLNSLVTAVPAAVISTKTNNIVGRILSKWCFSPFDKIAIGIVIPSAVEIGHINKITPMKEGIINFNFSNWLYELHEPSFFIFLSLLISITALTFSLIL